MLKKITRRATQLLFVLLTIFSIFLAIGAFSELENFAVTGAATGAAATITANAALSIIDNVNVVDVKTGVVLPTQSVVISANKIAFIGAREQIPTSYAELPQQHRVDGANGYLIPGLWDSHLHTLSTSPQMHFPLLVANGVTTIRDLGEGCSWRSQLNCVPDITRWREQQRDNKLLMPRIVASTSYHIESTEELENSSDTVAREKFRILIKSLKQRGDDFLKPQLTYDGNPRLFELLLEEAAEAKMVVAGHLPYRYDLARASSAPLVSVEHDSGLLPQCSRARLQYDGRNRNKATLLADMDSTRCDAVLKSMAAQSIAFVPTHVASNAQDYFLLGNEADNMPTLRYVVAPMRLLWRTYGAINKAGVDASDETVIQKMFQVSLDLTKRAHAAGVPVLVGTDALDAYVVHGFSIHDELQHFVKAGLSPIDALRAATIVPATHFGRANELGSIEVGKIADLVLLNANPLNGIEQTKNIRAVWLNGQHLSQDVLTEMLRWTATGANSVRLSAAFVWRMMRGN